VGDASLPAYQFWLVLGAVAGLHLPRWHGWVMRYRRWVLAVFPVALVVLLWTYFAQLPSRGALGASSPLQPVMIMWSMVALGVLYLLSVQIAKIGSSRVQSVFDYGAQLSFGVYLAHPMVLDVVLSLLRRLGLAAPQVWVSLVVLLCTTLGARLDPQRAPRLPRLPRPLLRLPRRSTSALLLAVSVLAVLVMGGDQSSPADSGTPTWEGTIESSDLVQPVDLGANSFCGGQWAAPYVCPIADTDPPVVSGPH
jgi:hypothetical protein